MELFVSLSYIYSQIEYLFILTYFYYYVEHLFITIDSFPFVIKVSVFFIIVNFAFSIYMKMRLHVIRREKEKREQVIKELRPLMVEFLEGILSSNKEYAENEILELFEEKFDHLNNRNYTSLIPALESVVEDNRDVVHTHNYMNVVRGLKIDIYLEKKLDFSNTRTRLRALQSFSKLQLTVSDSKILPHTYSKDTFLRKESRASYLGVSKNDPFKFFEMTKNNFNQWDQISLMQQFELHHTDNLPNFGKWIKYSEDFSQIIFFVRMVVHFNQKNSIEAIISLLEHDNHEVRAEAIIALGRLRVVSVEKDLLKMYYNQPIACQNAIIEALAYINSGESLEFLKLAFEEASNPDSKKLIAEVIYLYGEDGEKYFEVLCQQEKGFNYLILEHVKNPLISSGLKKSVEQNRKLNIQFATISKTRY